MKIFLDSVNITADIQAQTPIPDLQGGVYPNIGTKWYDLIRIVANHGELSNFFSSGGLHRLDIQDDDGSEFNAKMILRLTYSARNS